MLIHHSAVKHRRVYMGRRSWGLFVKGETVGKIGEVDDMDEGAARNET